MLVASGQVKDPLDKDSGHKPIAIAAVVSHPIQYQAPLFRALAARPDVRLKVYFCNTSGANAYQDRGFGVTVKWDCGVLAGYEHEFLPNYSPSPGVERPWGLINPGLVRCLRRPACDVVWVHGWAWLSNVIALGSAVAAGVPVLLRGETNGLAEPSGFRGIAKQAILRRLFGSVSGFLAVGTKNAEYYRSYGVPADRIFLAPYSVDNEHFTGVTGQLGAAREIRAANGLSQDRLVVLFAGKLVQRKRPQDIVRAVARTALRTRTTVVFAGSGECAESITSLASELAVDVRVLGFQNQSALPACYALADVFVLPSDFEPWGLVINEAMCCSLPVIASDKVGATADLIVEGKNGFTYPVGDVDALASRLDTVLGHTERRRSMGQMSRHIISRWGVTETTEGIVRAARAVCA